MMAGSGEASNMQCNSAQDSPHVCTFENVDQSDLRWELNYADKYPGLQVMEEEIKRSIELREYEFESILQIQEMQNRDLQNRLKSRVDDNKMKAIANGNVQLREHVAVLTSSLHSTQFENEKSRKDTIEQKTNAKLKISMLESQQKELISELQLLKVQNKEYSVKIHENQLEIENLVSSVKSLEVELSENKELVETLKKELHRERNSALEKFKEYESIKENTRLALEAQIKDAESRNQFEKIEHQRLLQQRAHVEAQLRDELRIRDQAFQEVNSEHSKTIQMYRAELNDTKHQLSIETDRLKDKISQLMKQNDTIGNTLRQVEDKCSEFRARSLALQQQNVWLTDEKNQLEIQLESSAQTIERHEAAIVEYAGVHTEVERYKLQCEFLKLEGEKLNEELQYKSQEVTRLETTQKSRHLEEVTCLKSDVKALADALNRSRAKYMKMKLKFSEQIAMAEQRVIDAVEGLKVRDLNPTGVRSAQPGLFSQHDYSYSLGDGVILY